MERWLDELVQMMLFTLNAKNISLLNPYKASHVKKDLKIQRERLRTSEREKKLMDIVKLLEQDL